jgi:hypothetical protein
MQRCFAYGDDVTYRGRAAEEQRLRLQGWIVVGWCYDERSALALPSWERPGLLDAIRQAMTQGVALVIPDALDVRSPIELLEIAAACKGLGVECCRPHGPVLGDGVGAADEIEFALKAVLNTIFRLSNRAVEVFSAGQPAQSSDGVPVTTDEVASEPVPATNGNQPRPIVVNIGGLREREYRRLARAHNDRLPADAHPEDYAPSLPTPHMPKRARCEAIGRLARFLNVAGYHDNRIAALLNELGVRSSHGHNFYGLMVRYYRETYGEPKAA